VSAAARSAPGDPLEVLDRTVAGLGGDDRPGQHRLASAVADAIADGHHLLAEAPTGSGKSLAYLAPIVAAGVRAVVATATLTLQDQLWRNDLPLLREHSGRRVSSALLKGRSNYLCLARLHGSDTDALFDERPGPTFTEDLAALHEFAEASDTGDVADLGDGVAPASWRAVTCGPNECPGATRCDHGVECFAERARFRAESVDIVVVNHALYAAHLAAGGQLLPPHDVLFDERPGPR
jgi:ATP-dependent DNA helicase DinG